MDAVVFAGLVCPVLLVMGMPVVLGVLAVRASVQRQHAIQEKWTAVASELGLRVGAWGVMAGALGGREVKVQAARTGIGRNTRRFTRFTVQTPKADLVLGADDLVSSLIATGLEVGDRDFDAAVRIRGEPLALGRLTAKVRASWLTLAGAGGLQLTRDELRWTASGWDHSAETLTQATRALAELAAVLDAPTPAADTLVALAAADPAPNVRRTALTHLIAHAERTDVQRALDTARSDPDLGVRLVVAEHLRTGDPELTEEAVTSPVTAHRVTGAGLAVRQQNRITLTWLLDDPESAVVRAAVDGLGRVGTVDDVRALRGRAGRAGLLSGLKAPIEDAIRRIQGRATGERGGLAVAADVGAGQLSEVPSPPARRKQET